MSVIQWRFPQPGERPAARLFDGLSVADVAEVLDQDLNHLVWSPATDLLLTVTGLTATRALLVSVLCRRNDGSLVWVVVAAQLANAEDTREWEQRGRT